MLRLLTYIFQLTVWYFFNSIMQKMHLIHFPVFTLQAWCLLFMKTMICVCSRTCFICAGSCWVKVSTQDAWISASELSNVDFLYLFMLVTAFKRKFTSVPTAVSEELCLTALAQGKELNVFTAPLHIPVMVNFSILQFKTVTQELQQQGTLSVGKFLLLPSVEKGHHLPTSVQHRDNFIIVFC